MAFNGSGVFARLYSWVADRDAAVNINATRLDAEMDGMATGLSNCVTKDGQTTITADLPMGGFKHTGVDDADARTQYAVVGQIQDGIYTYASVVGGTGDAITITLSPAITAYAVNQKFEFLAGATNTTAATVNVNSVGVKSIVKSGSIALAAGDITQGDLITIIYDGTNFQLQNVVNASDRDRILAVQIFS